MHSNKITPFSEKDSFILPNSPLKEKYITSDDSPNFSDKKTFVFPDSPTRKSMVVAKLISKRNNNDDFDEFDQNNAESPEKNMNRIYFNYLKNLVNEEENYEKNFPNYHNSPDHKDKQKEEDFEEIHGILLEEPLSEEFQTLYVAKKSIFDRLKLYSDPYPLLSFRKQLLYWKK